MVSGVSTYTTEICKRTFPEACSELSLSQVLQVLVHIWDKAGGHFEALQSETVVNPEEEIV